MATGLPPAATMMCSWTTRCCLLTVRCSTTRSPTLMSDDVEVFRNRRSHGGNRPRRLVEHAEAAVAGVRSNDNSLFSRSVASRCVPMAAAEAATLTRARRLRTPSAPVRRRRAAHAAAGRAPASPQSGPAVPPPHRRGSAGPGERRRSAARRRVRRPPIYRRAEPLQSRAGGFNVTGERCHHARRVTPEPGGCATSVVSAYGPRQQRTGGNASQAA